MGTRKEVFKIRFALPDGNWNLLSTLDSSIPKTVRALQFRDETSAMSLCNSASETKYDIYDALHPWTSPIMDDIEGLDTTTMKIKGTTADVITGEYYV
jgi:hypothetical protein